MNDEEKQKLNEIHSAVIGNEALGHEGLVRKVQRHEQWISSANVKAAMVIGGAGVVVFIIELLFRH